jgi:hypothetical protein
MNALHTKRLAPLLFNLRKPKRNIGFLSVLLESSVDLSNSMFALIMTAFKLQ